MLPGISDFFRLKLKEILINSKYNSVIFINLIEIVQLESQSIMTIRSLIIGE